MAVASSLYLVEEYYNPRLPSAETVYYVECLATGALVLLAFERMSGESRLLDHLAVASFPLYFLHDPVIYLFQDSLFALWLSMLGDSPFLVSVVTFVIELALCLALIRLIKRCTGRFSRRLIGG